MRHQKKKNTLDRSRAPRKALLTNLAESLVLHEKIKTTTTKARVLRPFVEKLVTRAKKSDLATRRLLLKQLFSENIVKKLLEVLGPRYKNRAGGYTRIIKLDKRSGDAAEEAIIEFV